MLMAKISLLFPSKLYKNSIANNTPICDHLRVLHLRIAAGDFFLFSRRLPLIFPQIYTDLFQNSIDNNSPIWA